MSKTRLRLSAVVLGLLIGLVFTEVAWRMYLFHFASQRHVEKWARMQDLPPELLKYRPHPYLAYCLNPAYRSSDGLNRHNSLGFRGAEFPRKKPPGVYRIACLGGSSTYDTKIADYRLSFPSQLQKVLREKYGQFHVQVINAGVGGYNSWESLIHLQLRVLDVEPDLVVVYHATNDVFARLIPPASYRRDNTGHRRAWTEEFHWWDRSLFLHYLGVQWGFSQGNSLGDRILVPYPKDPSMTTNPPEYFKANLENMVALSKYHGVEILLTSWAHCPFEDDYVSTPVYQQGFKEHNEISRQVALDNGVLYSMTSPPRCRPTRSTGRTVRIRTSAARAKRLSCLQRSYTSTI